jgi:hypothetical protein
MGDVQFSRFQGKTITSSEGNGVTLGMFSDGTPTLELLTTGVYAMRQAGRGSIVTGSDDATISRDDCPDLKSTTGSSKRDGISNSHQHVVA